MKGPGCSASSSMRRHWAMTIHRAAVDGFWMDQYPVTAAAVRRFVHETRYVTVAERPLDPADYPDADPALLRPGSLVFHKTTGPIDLSEYRNLLWASLDT